MRPLRLVIGTAAAIAVLNPAIARDWHERGVLVPVQSAPAPDRQQKPPRPEIKTLSEFGNAIHRCWKPPSRVEAPQDIMITVKLSFTRDGEVFGKPLVTYVTPGTSPEHEAVYRKAVAEAFLRCTPLNLSKGLGNAIAGRPFSFTFGNERGRHNA